MATWLRVSTAVDVALGPFVDSVDGFTPETALSLTQAECRLKKNGGAWAQKNNATTAPHEEEGWYEVNLSTTDTDTLGILVLAVYVTGALPVWREFMVVTAQVYDSYLSTDVLQVDVAQWLGTAAATPTVAGVPEVDVTHYAGSASIPAVVGGRYDVSVGAMQANVLTAAATAADFSTEVNTGIATAAAVAAVQADTDDIQARLPAALVGGKMESNVGSMTANVMTAAAADPGLTTELQTGLATAAALATVQADTDDIQARLPAALVGGRIDASVGAMAANVITAAATAADFSVEVNAAVLAVLGALADAAADGDPTSADTLMAYVKQLVNTLVGTAGIPSWPPAGVPGPALSLTEVIRQIYDEVAGLNGGALPAAAPTAAAVADAVWDEASADHVVTTSTGYQLLLAANQAPSAALVADAVWDEALAGHLTAGSTGAALNSAGAAGDPWSTALPGAYGAGSAGYLLGTTLPTEIAGARGQIDVVDNIIDTEIPDIQARLPAALVGGRMDASVGAMAANVITAAATAADFSTEVNTDMATVGHIQGLAVAVDALQTDTNDIQTRIPSALVDGRMDANVSGWNGEDVVTPNAPGTPVVDVGRWLGALVGVNVVGVPRVDVTHVQGTVQTGGDIMATVSSRATPAQVNAEVLDVLNVDNFGEPAQGAPAASTSLVAKIGFLYKLARNKVTSSSTEIQVYSDAGVVDHKATHADDGTTYSREEFVSGP